MPTTDNSIHEPDDDVGIITSMGMFWSRENILWNTQSPKLYGVQQIGADPVNFCSQIGIYLLYDGREVIYAGRTTDRPLGRRLYEHTKDRLTTRWDRFSWFGLLPVRDNGSLDNLPQKYEAEALIPALEAILIESLEPRQNRRGGDGFSGIEYMQDIGPDVAKSKAIEAIETVIRANQK